MNRVKGSGLRPNFSSIVEKARFRMPGSALHTENGDPYGKFMFVFKNEVLRVILSNGRGWDHVSVSLEDRCPTWDEMNWIKNLFFRDDCTVVQFHPDRSQYVNNHEFVLHLWHEQGVTYRLPPREFV